MEEPKPYTKPKVLLLDDEKQFEGLARGKNALLALEAFSGVLGMSNMESAIAHHVNLLQRKRIEKCALPECEMMKGKKGAYCCAEHCREHKRRQKEHKHK